MAYWKLFKVIEECEESEFMKQKMPGYTPGQIRYSYFQFTHPEDIKHHQRVIVMKKVTYSHYYYNKNCCISPKKCSMDKRSYLILLYYSHGTCDNIKIIIILLTNNYQDKRLFTGPGIRHRLDLDGPKAMTHPPNLQSQSYEEREHVFVQSSENARKLIPGTKYLFCKLHNNIILVTCSNVHFFSGAMMTKIDSAVYRCMYLVNESCNMEEFGRLHLGAYKQANGYGYFEFSSEEELETDVNVIVMDKVSNLYTQ